MFAVLDLPRSTNPHKSDTSWIGTGRESYGAHKVGGSHSASEHGELRPEVRKAREAGGATLITEEIVMISRIRHLKNSSYARSDISTHLI